MEGVSGGSVFIGIGCIYCRSDDERIRIHAPGIDRYYRVRIYPSETFFASSQTRLDHHTQRYNTAGRDHYPVLYH